MKTGSDRFAFSVKRRFIAGNSGLANVVGASGSRRRRATRCSGYMLQLPGVRPRVRIATTKACKGAVATAISGDGSAVPRAVNPCRYVRTVRGDQLRR